MVGLDSHGNAGLRDQVDWHDKRLFGFAALTSLFTAAFDISQSRKPERSDLPRPDPNCRECGRKRSERNRNRDHPVESERGIDDQRSFSIRPMNPWKT
jgi:hypothetical protein